MKQRSGLRKYFNSFTLFILLFCLTACGTLEVRVEGIVNHRVLEVGVEAPALLFTPTPTPLALPLSIAILTVTSTPTILVTMPPSPQKPTDQPIQSPTSEATVTLLALSATPTSVARTPTLTPVPTATDTPVPPTATNPSPATTVAPSTVTTAKTPTATTAPLLQILNVKVIYHDAERESAEGVAFYRESIEPWLDLLVLLSDNHWYGPERQEDEIVAAPLPDGYRWETDGGFLSSANGEVWWNHNGNEGQARLYYRDTLLSQQRLRIDFITSGGSNHNNNGGGGDGPTIK